MIESMFEKLSTSDLILLALVIGHKDPALQISEYDRTHVGEVISTGNWWGADMLRLIKRSDQGHRTMLSICFPTYVSALEAWEKSPDGVVT